MKVAILLPVYNQPKWTKVCYETLRKYTKKGLYDLFVLENGSTDEEFLFPKDDDLYFFRVEKNIGFGAGVNQLAAWAKFNHDYEFYCWIHNDFCFTENWLEGLLSVMADYRNCMKVGCSQFIDRNAKDIPDEERNEIAKKFKQDIQGTANLDPALVRKETFEKFGHFDPLFEQQECEDVDYNKRIMDAGYQVLGTQRSIVWHGMSITRATTPEATRVRGQNQLRFLKKHNVEDFEKWNHANKISITANGRMFALYTL